MRYYFRYIIHFLRSNSRHGTHSPFVYQLADEVIYNVAIPMQPKRSIDVPPRKYGWLLKQILIFLHVQQVVEYGKSYALDHAALFISEDNHCSVGEVLHNLSAYTVIVVDGIYRSTHAHKQWEELILAPEVTVSIDLFHFGLLLQRAGQQKENFRLRYPFWLR